VEEVFIHRQLYVWLSRAICANQVKVLLSDTVTGKVGECQNIVFTELFDDWFQLFQFRMCEKVGLWREPPEISPATVFFLLHLYPFSLLCFLEVLMIDLSYFKFCMCEKVEGLGKPQK
jgi:hypothetical protein